MKQSGRAVLNNENIDERICTSDLSHENLRT